MNHASDKAHAEKFQKKKVWDECLSGDALEIILHFIYLGKVNDGLSDVNVKEVLYGATMFLLDDLKILCEDKLLKQCEQPNYVSFFVK